MLVTTTTSGRSSTMSMPRSNKSTNTTRASNASSSEFTAFEVAPAFARTNDRSEEAPCTATGAIFDVQSPSESTAPIASDFCNLFSASRADVASDITIAFNASDKPACIADCQSASISIKSLSAPSAPVVFASSPRLEAFAATDARSVSTRALSPADAATAFA